MFTAETQSITADFKQKKASYTQHLNPGARCRNDAYTHKHSYVISQTYTCIFSINRPRLGAVSPPLSFLTVLVLIVFAHSNTINTVLFLFWIFFGCGSPLWQNVTSRNSGYFCNLSILDCHINCNFSNICCLMFNTLLRSLVGAASGCFSSC